MQKLFENWREFLKEEKNVFYVSVSSLLPTEELGHGKDHDCPSQACNDVIQQKMDLLRNNNIEPLEVCNQAPINPYRLKGKQMAPKTGLPEPFYFVLDGHHRLEAAKKLGIGKLPVYLTPLESR